MNIAVSTEVAERLERLSASMHFEKAELAERAITVYVDQMERLLELEDELAAWERASDEALTSFEKSL
ncbi:hypothetical protein HY642_05610 [Candidatus Woesearchaeota archaeon]|nr:hypothetical protein [Candidatus Woesearchaeota archaeon]